MFDRLKLSFIIFKETFCRRLYYWKRSKYFIEWDYTSILLAEKAAIERMLKTYKNTDEMSKYTIDRLQLALNLLDIILGNKEITKRIKNQDESKKDSLIDFGKIYCYKLLVPVNIKNAKRFSNNTDIDLLKKYKGNALFEEEYYIRKAFYIYNKLRFYNMQTWWT